MIRARTDDELQSHAIALCYDDRTVPECPRKLSCLARFAVRGLLCSTCALLCLAIACNKPSAANATTRTTRPGDRLLVEIHDVTPGVANRIPVRLSDKGEIRLPLVWDIKAAGFTTAELERAIKKVYKENGIVRDCAPSVKFDD